MRISLLSQLCFLSLPIFAQDNSHIPIDPYNQIVFVSNSIQWPYNKETYGTDSFLFGEENNNEDTKILNQVMQNGFHFNNEKMSFGVASSSYQYEGKNASQEALSIWDTFSQKGSWLNPNGTNIAEVPPTSEYTKPNGEWAILGIKKENYELDIEFAKKLGVKTYRLSISWPRLFPNLGMKEPDASGVEYYISVLKTLQKAGITPLITLYHWDLPNWLYNFGMTSANITQDSATYGWLDMNDAYKNVTLLEFQKYVAASYKAFGAYTPYFSTFNEPLTFTNSTFTDNNHAPGQYGWEKLIAKNSSLYGHNKEEFVERAPYLQAINIIKAHDIAYKTIHALHTINSTFPEPRVSIVLNSDWAEPYRIQCEQQNNETTSCQYNQDDIHAAKNNMDFMLGWWLHPVMFGTWPESMNSIYTNRITSVGLAKDASCLTDNGVPIFCVAKDQLRLVDDMKQGGTLDLIALNHYTGYFAVDQLYAKEHFNKNIHKNSVPPNQYGITPQTIQAGWNADQNAFTTQFRYQKFGNSGEFAPEKRVFVIGNSGNKPWLRQTWFVYRKLLQYVDNYYIHQNILPLQNIHPLRQTKSGKQFSMLDIYLTENGASIYKESQNNNLNDTNRIQFLLGNLGAVQQAIDDGISVKLYTYWSIADNFEWAEGYDSRFGLLWIDYENQFKRVPKQSYKCYQKIILENSVFGACPLQ